MSRIWVTDRYVELQLTPDELDIELKSIARNIYRMPRKQDIYRCSLRLLPAVLFCLRGWDEDNIPDGEAKQALAKELDRQRTTQELKMHGTDIQYGDLWEHQNLGVELAKVNDRYNFFYDTRTGKTRMSYQIMQNALIQPAKIRRALVITPATVIPDWLKDAKEFPAIKVAAFYGTEKQKHAALHTPCHVMLWSAGMVTQNLDFLIKIGFDMVFFDESSKAKSHKSKLSDSLLKLSQKVKYWYNLSATPAPNGEYEYYRQMQYVDPYGFNPTWTYFKNAYFDNLSYNPKYEKLYIKPKRKDEFMDIVENCSIYIDQSVMPTSKAHWEITSFPMSQDKFDIYESMRRSMATEIPSGDETTKIVTDFAAAARSKLCQITSNFILDTDAIEQNKIHKRLGEEPCEREVWQLDPPNRRIAALLADLSRVPGQSVVIWAYYRQEFEDIQNALGDQCRIVYGGMSVKEKNACIAAFRSKEFPYLVAHPASIGLGINLTVAHHAIYYRVTDSWELLKQSSERIRGHITVQPFDCEYTVLCATTPDGRPTVDQLVYNNVTGKRDASTGVLNYLRTGAYNAGN